MTLGSLFDGSGGFPLAGMMCGITPMWASEIEPFPVKVTTSRFPDMKHLGDITKINGADIEPVDVITFGSPCQGLSVAGLQKGLDDDRSGLFLEAIRIIKEMRESTNGRYPTFAVWENVPGAFSSNKGEDFLTVLQEFCKIKDPSADVPRPNRRKGKNAGLHWNNAGSIMADGYSIAWRILDAQYWGVPQRRRRIFLVADFRGQRAAEILFKREGLRGHTPPGKKERQGVTAFVDGSINTADFSGQNSITAGLEYVHNGSPTLRTGAQANIHIYDARGNGNGDICPTITGDHNRQVSDYTAICIAGNTIDRQPKNGGNGVGCQANISYTLNTVDRHAVAFEPKMWNTYNEPAGALLASGYKDPQCVIASNIVRRLIPLECCRLQGFPDWWCNDIDGSDGAQYKMWGNGVALPCVLYVLEGIALYE